MYVVNAKASHAAAGAMDGAGGLDVGRQGSEFVGHDAHLPGAAAVGRKAHYLGRSFAFVARAEGASFYKGRHDLGGAFAGQFFGTLGALGGDDDPLFGEVVLAYLGHI
jgi:hypothetical protein